MSSPGFNGAIAFAIAFVGGGSSVNERLSVYAASGASPTAGTLTATSSGIPMDEFRISVVEFDGVPITNITTGSADAIRQIVPAVTSATFATWSTASAGYLAGRDPTFSDPGWAALNTSGNSFDAWRPDQDLNAGDATATLLIGLELVASGIFSSTSVDVGVDITVVLDVITLAKTITSKADIGVGVSVIFTIATPPIFKRGRGPLKIGKLQAFIGLRGGGTLEAALKTSNLAFGYVLTSLSNASLTCPVSQSKSCKAILADLQPFEHEIIITRDDEIAWGGIPDFPAFSPVDVTISARDFSAWLDVRWVAESRNFSGEDLVTMARILFEDTMEVDNSPGISVSAELSGITGTRNFDVKARRDVGAEWRDLASAFDFTTIGRELIVRPSNQAPSGIRIGPEHLSPESLTLVGIGAASQVAVVGARNVIEATLGGTDADIGLVQVATSDPRILDVNSAQGAAQTLLDQARKPPVVLKGRLKPNAPLYFDDLIPGTIFDVSTEVGLRSVDDLMRLVQVDVADAGNGEVVTATFSTETP